MGWLCPTYARVRRPRAIDVSAGCHARVGPARRARLPPQAVGSGGTAAQEGDSVFTDTSFQLAIERLSRDFLVRGRRQERRRGKIPVAIATSFVARLLIMGTGQLMQKCVSRRGGHDWISAAKHRAPPALGRSQVCKFSRTRRSWHRGADRDRFGVIELLLKGGISTARPIDPERQNGVL